MVDQDLQVDTAANQELRQRLAGSAAADGTSQQVQEGLVGASDAAAGVGEDDGVEATVVERAEIDAQLLARPSRCVVPQSSRQSRIIRPAARNTVR